MMSQPERQRMAALENALREVLSLFTERGHPGEPCRRTGWIPQGHLDRLWTLFYPGIPAAGTSTSGNITDSDEGATSIFNLSRPASPPPSTDQGEVV